MENLNNAPEDLIECGLSLSKLNQYMNKVYSGTAFNPHLLSFDEANKVELLILDNLLPNVLDIRENWWLSSPAGIKYHAMIVGATGFIFLGGDYMCGKNGVRPAFHVENSKQLNFKLGDKVKIAEEPYTIVLIEDGKATALCDCSLFFSEFNETECEVDYQASSVKFHLENYFKDKDLKVEVIKSQTLDELLIDMSSKNLSPNSSEEALNGR